MDIFNFKTYDELINYYLTNPVDDSIYTEKHHIIPVSEGGENSVLLNLPFHAHAYAHYLRAVEHNSKNNYLYAYRNINAARLIISSSKLDFNSSIEEVKSLILGSYKNFSKYVTNGEKSFRVHEDKLKEFLENNKDYRLGRKFKSPKGRCWVNNGIIQTYVDNEKVENFLKENPTFKKGMMPFIGEKKKNENFKGSTFGKKWVNKDGIRKNVSKEELESYLNDGWILGSGNHGKRKVDPDKKFCTGYKWMHNDDLKKSKQVNPEKIDMHLKSGWNFGRKFYKTSINS